ncbi:GNAT family N-acetyltransferase [Breznakiella homolactica]|uniref:GNAT family N-acetyltransferase n=1 Tax=Breznakiella homolactica TaxID=2798577 RepID=A0A7T8B9W7_9SPIR|nr:GNAT family protein [Breznakiella homolactica]QQO10054.1 GNAT family N-acetyltransferase [Breznakiella homolactica]
MDSRINEFTSPRLTCRAVQEEDFPAIAALISDPEVMRYTFQECLADEPAQRAYFSKMLSGAAAAGPWVSFAVYNTKNRNFIGLGDCEFKYIKNNPVSAEIGYFLAREHWNQGYATEIAERLMDLCFAGFGVQKVNASCHSGNAASERIMRKIGMRPEGCLRRERIKEGLLYDELRYGILREEWIDIAGQKR